MDTKDTINRSQSNSLTIQKSKQNQPSNSSDESLQSQYTPQQIERADKILQILYDLIGEARCELNYATHFQLLIAVILSAQCTDVRVNIVTQKLFQLAPTAQDLANLDLETITSCIQSLGFFRHKAQNIQLCARRLVEHFNGIVPSTRQELMSLAGVGQKTANVVLHECFNQPLIAVDTHVFRVSHRLGLSNASTPNGVEEDLYQIISPQNHFITHHTLLLFGRYHCTSQRPKCGNCLVQSYCNYHP